MAFLDPMTSRLGWRPVILISPHPPEDCRTRLLARADSAGAWFAEHQVGMSLDGMSGALWRNYPEGGSRFKRGALVRIRLQPEGSGMRIRCQQGVNMLFALVWLLMAAFVVALTIETIVKPDTGPHPVTPLGVGSEGVVSLCVVLWAHVRGSGPVGRFLIDYVTEAAEARVA